MDTTTRPLTTLHTELLDMTGAASVAEAVFVPWEPADLAELDGLLLDLSGLDRLDRALSGD